MKNFLDKDSDVILAGSIRNFADEREVDIPNLDDWEDETESQTTDSNKSGDIENASTADTEEEEEDEYDANLALMTFYYLRSGFKKWLINERNLKIKPAKDYLQRLTRLSVSLLPYVGYDLFEMLGIYLNFDSTEEEMPLYDNEDEEIDEKYDFDSDADYDLEVDESDVSDEIEEIDELDLDEEFETDDENDSWESRYDEMLLKLESQLAELNTRFLHAAPTLVDDYITVFKQINRDDKDYKKNLRVLTVFHAFIVDLSGSHSRKYMKKKTLCLPDEEAFKDWMVTEYKMDYKEAGKIVSSIKRMDLILPSLVSDPMSFLDVLRALPVASKRDNYIALIKSKKQAIYRSASCSSKTISNGWSNIGFYLKFLNHKN